MRSETWHNGRLVEQSIDNGDGTGARITYDPKTGKETSREDVTGLPIETPPEPDAITKLAALLVDEYGLDPAKAASVLDVDQTVVEAARPSIRDVIATPKENR